MINEVECPNCGGKVPAGNLMCQQCMARIPDTSWPEPGEVIPVAERPRRKPRWWIVAVLVFVFLLLLVATIMAPLLAGNRSGSGNVAARQAQTQQGAYAIQLALERYAVDNGYYPSYLSGGDPYFNIGTVNYYSPNSYTGAAYWRTSLIHPFDTQAIAGPDSDYHDANWQAVSSQQVGFGDALLNEGYLKSYPANPFLKNSSPGNTFGQLALQLPEEAFAGYGGINGEAMWNTGYYGELPLYKWSADGSYENRNDFPGQFYYHPKWLDGVSNSGHLASQQLANTGSNYPAQMDKAVGPTQDDSSQATSSQVYDYDLITYGASAGMDVDNSVIGKGTANIFRTGYMTNSIGRNPYIPNAAFGDYHGACQPFGQRPYSDGVDDFILMTLSGKMQGVHPQTPPLPEVTSSEDEVADAHVAVAGS